MQGAGWEALLCYLPVRQRPHPSPRVPRISRLSPPPRNTCTTPPHSLFSCPLQLTLLAPTTPLSPPPRALRLRIVKSPTAPALTCPFRITDAGVEDST